MLLAEAETSLIGHMEKLRHGIENSDPVEISEAAHSIKGTSGSLFAVRISNLAAVIEDNAVDLDMVRAMMPVMEQTETLSIEWWRNQSAPS